MSQVTLLDVMSNSLFASMFRLASSFRLRCILFREQFISSRAIYFLASKFREHVSQSPFSTYLLREKVLSDRRQLRRRARQKLSIRAIQDHVLGTPPRDSMQDYISYPQNQLRVLCPSISNCHSLCWKIVYLIYVADPLGTHTH